MLEWVWNNSPLIHGEWKSKAVQSYGVKFGGISQKPLK